MLDECELLREQRQCRRGLGALVGGPGQGEGQGRLGVLLAPDQERGEDVVQLGHEPDNSAILERADRTTRRAGDGKG